MIDFIKNYLINFGISEEVSNIIAIISILIISLLVYIVAKKLLLKVLDTYINKSKIKWLESLKRSRIVERLTWIIPASIIHAFAPILPKFQTVIQRVSYSFIILVILITIDKLLDVLNDVYNNYKVSKTKPIKGFLQVIKIISYVVGIIAIIGILIDRSPWLLISGIGAATAVLLLIFQNSILGFVAGIQLSANDMVRIGDWISMPKYGADGDVTEISLHTVKVQNWDKTITTIPSYALISESFINWRGMTEYGGRRIKRSINIDITSIKFCTEEMLERYKKIQYIQQYLEQKQKEIDTYNKAHNIDTSTLVNGRHLTNIGTLRAYIQSYLENHPKVSKNMTMLVRQLQPTENGLPIEIYIFTDDIAWANYEAIQSDIFDHILAIIPEFDLRIYQAPSGFDMRSINLNKNSV